MKSASENGFLGKSTSILGARLFFSSIFLVAADKLRADDLFLSVLG